MGEHDKRLGEADAEIDSVLLGWWADGNGHSVEGILADPDLLERFLRWQRNYFAAVEEGLEDIRAGRTVSHEEMLEYRAEQRRRYFERK